MTTEDDPLEVKKYVRKTSLPALCGPTCALWDPATHQCKATGKPRNANTSCTEGYTDDTTKLLSTIDWTSLTVDKV